MERGKIKVRIEYDRFAKSAFRGYNIRRKLSVVRYLFFFQYGWQLVLIQWILISFKVISGKLYLFLFKRQNI